MGFPVLVGYGILLLIGVLLLGAGAFRRSRNLLVAGAAILLAHGGLWIIGFTGMLIGLLPVVFLRTKR
jgi:hypothetical protein